MDAFLKSIKAFFASLGHNLLADIITALPELQQVALQAISALIQAAILYVEAKYGTQPASAVLKADAPLTAEAKMALDNQRSNDALAHVKAAMAANPSAYPVVPDSLIRCGIEIYVQKAKRDAEGNHGNFVGGNSNA